MIHRYICIKAADLLTLLTWQHLPPTIRDSTSGVQASTVSPKHLTAMPYMPVFSSKEYIELVKDAIESAVDFLDYRKNEALPIVFGEYLSECTIPLHVTLLLIRRRECTLLKSIMTMWDEVEASQELLENYPLHTYLTAVIHFLRYYGHFVSWQRRSFCMGVEE